MPTERFPAEGIIGIATVNIPAYNTFNTDGTDDIVLVAPDGLPCRAALVPTPEGTVLYIEGDSAEIKGGLNLGGGGFTLQVGSVGNVRGAAASQMVAIHVPPDRDIPKMNMAPGVVNWTKRK